MSAPVACFSDGASGKPADDLQVKPLAVDTFSAPTDAVAAQRSVRQSAGFVGARYLMQPENLIASLLWIRWSSNS